MATAPIAGATRWRQELREILHLAWPLVLGQLSAIGMNVVDTVLAGHYDADTLAAVAIGTNVWSLAIVAAIGVMLALPPSVAQLAGAGETWRAGALFRQALWLALGVGLLLFALVRNVDPLLATLGIEPRIVADSRRFLHAIAWGAPALVGYFALRGLSEGLARTRPTMYFGGLGLILLIPLGYVAIFGAGGLPARGAQGSGLANAIVLWLQFGGFALYVARHPQYRATAPFARWEWPRPRVLAELLRLGVPMGVSLLLEAGLFIAAALLVGTLGARVVAGHQIAINVASLAFMLPLGIAMATTVRVGRAIGRGDVQGARQAGFAGIFASLGTQMLSCALMIALPQRIAAWYTDDALVARQAAQLLLLAAVFQFSDGIQATANGALRGLKDTTVPMAITALAYWGVGMPVGWTLTFLGGLGVSGMWIGFIAGLSTAALLLTLRFARLTSRRVAG
jgi:MATE family multidrug resistance protein